MLSRVPTDWFEPNPMKPLFRPLFSPSITRGPYRYEKDVVPEPLPGAFTITFVPFTWMSRLYVVPALAWYGVNASWIQPLALRWPTTSLFVEMSMPANLKSVGDQ